MTCKKLIKFSAQWFDSGVHVHKHNIGRIPGDRISLALNYHSLFLDTLMQWLL